MKFDKESIIAITICMLLLFAWPWISSKIQPITPQTTNTPGTSESVKNPSSSENKTEKQPILENGNNGKEAKPDNIVPEILSPKLEGPVKSEQEQDILLPDIPSQVLSNDFSEITLNPTAGGIEKVVLKKFLADNKKGPVEFKFDRGTAALAVSEKGKKWKLTDIKALKDLEVVTIERTFSSGVAKFLLIQEWQYSDNYTISYRMEISNKGESRLEIPELLVSTGGLPPIYELTGDIITSEYQIIDVCLAENKAVKSQYPEKTPFNKLQENSALWIAVTNKYFTVALIPDEPFLGGNMMDSKEFKTLNSSKKEYNWFYLESSGIIKDILVAPGEKYERKLKFYAGPKEYNLLKKLAPKATILTHFGWAWLEGISQLLLVCLIWLKNISGTYGMSIILLTVIVKLIFWPITEKANNSMKKMQKIQPIVQEIRSKYKNDPQKMNQKIMLLYKEQKVNPIGGCLPILMQMPVFFALYNTLGSAVELRHSSFLWAGDLSRPDTIFAIPLASLGSLPFNPLILLMTGTMVIQQKLTPSVADPMQQKMMMMMPFIMLFMLYSLPSGLTLYWTVNQCISIVQLLHNKHRDKKKEEEESKVKA